MIAATAEYRRDQQAANGALMGLVISFFTADTPCQQAFAVAGEFVADEQASYLTLSILAWEYRSYGCA